MVRRYREGPVVEKLVVQSAQRVAVVHLVRPARLVPHDVRGLDAHSDGADPQVETAYGASVLVRHEHRIAEVRVPLTSARCDHVAYQADRVQDVPVQGLRKVLVEQHLCGFRDATGLGQQSLAHPGCQLATRIRRAQGEPGTTVRGASAPFKMGRPNAHVMAERVQGLGVSLDDLAIRQLLELTSQVIGLRLRLPQHPGGLVLTKGPLSVTVPIENRWPTGQSSSGTRQTSARCLLKVDVLALRLLTASLHRCHVSHYTSFNFGRVLGGASSYSASGSS